jgi:F0F1-type ATP synthase alpha subunit
MSKNIFDILDKFQGVNGGIAEVQGRNNVMTRKLILTKGNNSGIVQIVYENY